jgi:signal transduction histidine kinase/ActR/RegA family two-component response regulator
MPPSELLLLPLLAAIGIAALLALIVVRRVRSRLASLERELDAGRSREAALRATDRAKDEFLAMLGHELRNPLAALAAVAHVLRAKAKDDAVLNMTDVLGRQVQHMSRLTEDLLDVSRVTRGRVSLNRQPLDFARVVEHAVGEMKLSGRLDRHDLRMDLSPVWVRADGARIEQIVANLVGNAVKYTPERGTIEVTLRRDRNTAVLRVRDTGIGMAPEFVARVFDLFVQAEGPGRQAGLGIGLTLVRHLAELHGGKAFAASSGPGQGSVFTITLPAIEAQAVPAPLDEITPPQARHRILLVEDNVDARSTMLEALQLDGHSVYEAPDGESGLRTAAAVQPDVAIIDIGLPGRDGYEVASALRQTLERPEMVLIAVTGYEQPDSMRRAREAGFDEYVTKPIAPDRLARLIDAAFAAKARRQPDPSLRARP